MIDVHQLKTCYNVSVDIKQQRHYSRAMKVLRCAIGCPRMLNIEIIIPDSSCPRSAPAAKYSNAFT